MADQSFQEKTEKATPKKRGEARDEGNVARSVEVNSAVVLLVGILTMYFMGTWLSQRIQLGMVTTFRESSKIDLQIDYMNNLAMIALKFMIENIAPLAFIILVFGIVSNVLQVGLLFTMKPLQPKLTKLNPISGIKRLVTFRSLIELVKGILKISIIGYFAYTTIKGEYDKFYLLMDSNISAILTFIGKLAFKLVFKITIILVILAILDYIYQKYEYEKNLKMSKQEVQDEFKQAEGDPQVRRRIRTLQRQLLLNAMIKELPDADVVITNPTHFAVALKYDSDAMSAPKVVAKGARKMAEKIKEIAIKHNIPIVENKELAQALYKSVEIGMEIPSKFYQAVAEVLSYVYRLKNKRFV